MSDPRPACVSVRARSLGHASIATIGAIFLTVVSVGSASALRTLPTHSASVKISGAVSTVLPPALGVWKSENFGTQPGQGKDVTGSLRVIPGEYLTALHGTITKNAETSCGTGTISVPGKLKIIHATGEDAYGSFNLYAAGTINTSADPIVQPVRMVILHNGKKVTGSVSASFVWPPKTGTLSGAEINYGQCQLSLAFLHV